MKNRYLILVFSLFLSISLCSCNVGKWRGHDLRGSYETDIHETFEDEDGIVCNVFLKTSQNLESEGMDLIATMRMDVRFSGVLEFKDLSMIYDISMRGHWDINGDTLVVTPVQDSFKSEFKSSNATRPTEEAMVKHMRKYVSENLEKRIMLRLAKESRVVMRIDSVTDVGICGRSDDCPFIMRRL